MDLEGADFLLITGHAVRQHGVWRNDSWLAQREDTLDLLYQYMVYIYLEHLLCTFIYHR